MDGFLTSIHNKLHKSNWLIAKELNLKIFTTYELKYFQISMKGMLITDVNLVEHYKQIQAYWRATDVYDYRITAQEPREAHDDMLEALDDIGIMNLENAMKV